MVKDPFEDNLFLANILQALIDHGFSLPIHCAIVGVNGSVSATLIQQCSGGLSSTRTVEHVVDGQFGVPINIFFVDAQGEAVRVLVGKDGQAELVN